MLNLEALFAQYQLRACGVIHVGAHIGEEYPLYRRMGFDKIVFIEAQPDTFNKLAGRMYGLPGVKCLRTAISDTNGTATFHVANNNESSSLLKMKHHTEMYPGIMQTHTVQVETMTLLDVAIREDLNVLRDYNFLHLDIQGMELAALKGARSLLTAIDAISCELNFKEMYEGCGMADAVDGLLGTYSFKRVETVTAGHPEWGDGFYVKA